MIQQALSMTGYFDKAKRTFSVAGEPLLLKDICCKNRQEDR